MTYLKRVRWMSCSALLAALFLFSGHASAIMVTIDNFVPTGGALVLDFDGHAGANGLLEEIELTSFSAVYTAPIGPSPLSWGLADLPLFSYNMTTGIVEDLFVFNLDLFVELEISLLGTANSHYAIITDLFSDFQGEVVAYTNEFPSPGGEVPSPGTLLLLALGLLAMGSRQLISSRARRLILSKKRHRG